MSKPKTRSEAKKFIEDLGSQIKKDIITSGRHYMVLANGIPCVQCKADELQELAIATKDMMIKDGHPESDLDKLIVKDLLSGESKTLTSYL